MLGKNSISLSQVIQENAEEENGGVPLVLVSHETSEKHILKAVEEINAIDKFAKVQSVIRVVT